MSRERGGRPGGCWLLPSAPALLLQSHCRCMHHSVHVHLRSPHNSPHPCCFPLSQHRPPRGRNAAAAVSFRSSPKTRHPRAIHFPPQHSGLEIATILVAYATDILFVYIYFDFKLHLNIFLDIICQSLLVTVPVVKWQGAKIYPGLSSLRHSPWDSRISTISHAFTHLVILTVSELWQA